MSSRCARSATTRALALALTLRVLVTLTLILTLTLTRCEIGDHEGLWSLLRKAQREEATDGSLNSAGGVKALVGATTKDGATPLYYACKNGFLECARVLLDFGGTCRGTDSGGFTPLWVACARGHYECAELMLRQPGATVDQRARDGRTPLYAACEGGNLSCVRMVLDAKADIEARRVG